MCRTRSEDKRDTILETIEVLRARWSLGRHRWDAEGPLFTYFETKDHLVNTLYRKITLSLAHLITAGLPRKKNVRSRLEHLWNRYVAWGLDHPNQQRVLRQIELWHGLIRESRKTGAAPFAEIKTIMGRAKKRRMVQELPRRSVEASIKALAETVMQLSRQSPLAPKTLHKAAFEMLCSGIARP